MRKILFIIHAIVFAMMSCQNHPVTSNPVVHNDTIIITQIVTDTVFIDRSELAKPCYKDTDTVLVVEIPAVLLAPTELDSIQTQRVMEESLWKNYIDIPIDYNKDYWANLYHNADLSQLPYLLLSAYPSHGQIDGLLFDLTPLCSGVIDDPALFALGKQISEKVCEIEEKYPPVVVKKQNGKEYALPYPVSNYYPDSFTPTPLPTGLFEDDRHYSLSNIDTLRIRVIAHRDREALKELEKYYHDKGDDKGIAIYYKVLLSYEGNGDLAEKFFKVLEPHFIKTPHLRTAAREVLLRAALCDHNERAQELCDSLGFSLCDYRLPLPAADIAE